MMMNIIPFKKVGMLEFGMEREKIRKFLGPNYVTFKKSLWELNTTDDYSELGLHLYYTEDDKLEFIEMFPPAQPIFNEVNLFEVAMKEAVNLLLRFDNNPEIDKSSYIFHKVGIAFYIQSSTIEAVSAFSEDYYVI